MEAKSSTHPSTESESSIRDDGFEEFLDEREKNISPECKKLLLSLPRDKGWFLPYHYLYQNFWCLPNRIQPIIYFQQRFQAKDDDIIVATFPKSGTTWIKALVFAIVNRTCFPPSQSDNPLLTFNSHDLVPQFETKIYAGAGAGDGFRDVSGYMSAWSSSSSRIFGTHVPFPSLPDSIKSSNCKIIYLCRNPFDNFVSSWIFYGKLRPASLPPLTLEEAFEMYCKGNVRYGPFWSHILGYWKESKETPNKVLFLKYEDLKEHTKFHVKRIAKFLDCPFSSEEESDGVIEDIIHLCSLKKMKNLEVNKSGKFMNMFDNKEFFRNGEIGDWVNYLSPSMVKKLSDIVEEKLSGSGLSLKLMP